MSAVRSSAHLLLVLDAPRIIDAGGRDQHDARYASGLHLGNHGLEVGLVLVERHVLAHPAGIETTVYATVL